MDVYSARGRATGWLWPAAILIVASSYRFIEKPAIRFGHALSKRAKLDTVRKRLKLAAKQKVELAQELADL